MSSAALAEIDDDTTGTQRTHSQEALRLLDEYCLQMKFEVPIELLAMIASDITYTFETSSRDIAGNLKMYGIAMGVSANVGFVNSMAQLFTLNPGMQYVVKLRQNGTLGFYDPHFSDLMFYVTAFDNGYSYDTVLVDRQFKFMGDKFVFYEGHAELILRVSEECFSIDQDASRLPAIVPTPFKKPRPYVFRSSKKPPQAWNLNLGAREDSFMEIVEVLQKPLDDKSFEYPKGFLV